MAVDDLESSLHAHEAVDGRAGISPLLGDVAQLVGARELVAPAEVGLPALAVFHVPVEQHVVLRVERPVRTLAGRHAVDVKQVELALRTVGLEVAGVRYPGPSAPSAPPVVAAVVVANTAVRQGHRVLLIFENRRARRGSGQETLTPVPFVAKKIVPTSRSRRLLIPIRRGQGFVFVFVRIPGPGKNLSVLNLEG